MADIPGMSLRTILVGTPGTLSVAHDQLALVETLAIGTLAGWNFSRFRPQPVGTAPLQRAGEYIRSNYLDLGFSSICSAPT